MGSDAFSDSATPHYGGEDFRSLSAAARELEDLRRSGQWSRLLLAAGRRRRALWRGARALRQLHQLDLPVTPAPQGQAIRDSVRSRSTRVARAVLRLPGDRAQYQRGRSRQALRTNVRHAAALGITCHRLPPAERDAALDGLLHRFGADVTSLEVAIGLEPSRQEYHAAVDEVGDVIAVAILEVDVHCARLVYLRAVTGELGGPARYALSLHVIDSLIDRQVSLLLVGGAVRLAPGLQYFQQRLGFEIFNVRPVTVTVADDGLTRGPRPQWARRTARSRVVVTLLVILSATIAWLFNMPEPAGWGDLLETLVPDVKPIGVAMPSGGALVLVA
jgi:hypothetical protein